MERRAGRLAATVCATAFAALMLAPARAQTYPTRPIRLIVPIATGSVTDVIMRAAATEIGPNFAPLVIENKGGASGIPGAEGVRAGA